jgi:hypothetical protein
MGNSLELANFVEINVAFIGSNKVGTLLIYIYINYYKFHIINIYIKIYFYSISFQNFLEIFKYKKNKIINKI